MFQIGLFGAWALRYNAGSEDSGGGPPAVGELSAAPAGLVARPVSVALPAVTARPVRSARELWLETGVVLTLAVFPHFIAQFFSSYTPRDAFDSFGRMAAWTLVSCVQVAVPVLYLMHRSREPWATFGITRPRWLKDAVIGVLLYLAAYVLYVLGYGVLQVAYDAIVAHGSAAESESPPYTLFPIPRGWLGGICVVALSVINGFTEELVMRGYLIPRFERLLGRGLWAVLLTTALFAAYHSYQGALGVLSAGIGGLLCGAVFCYTRRLWPVVVAHILSDLVAFGLMMLH